MPLFRIHDTMEGDKWVEGADLEEALAVYRDAMKEYEEGEEGERIDPDSALWITDDPVLRPKVGG